MKKTRKTPLFSETSCSTQKRGRKKQEERGWKSSLVEISLAAGTKTKRKINEFIIAIRSFRKSHAIFCPIDTIALKMEALRYNPRKLFSVKFAERLIMVLTVVFLCDSLLFVSPTLAYDAVRKMENKALDIVNDVLDAGKLSSLPKNEPKVYTISYTLNRTITAYNSEVGQTDDSPCVTANGFNVCEHGIEDTIAANFLPFGTKVSIPELFGDRIFVVRDRMNTRYPDRVDVWFKDKQEARVFGVRRATIQVLEKVDVDTLAMNQ